VTRRRATPDGLPYRVYEYRGERTYSIGYKAADGTWPWRQRCKPGDEAAIKRLRQAAIAYAASVGADAPPAPSDDSFAALADAWLKWQHSKPEGSESRRADTTLAENEREIRNLKKAFGHQRVDLMEKTDAYTYLDACEENARAAKGNKEISLARVILEYGIRRGKIKVNPFDGVEKLVTAASARYVSDQELALAVEVGRRLGGARHIVAMALKTAWLCVRRSVEVRGLTVDHLKDDGIEWVGAKRKKGQAPKRALIEWTPELQATIDEARSIPRNKLAGSWYVFGNLSGQRYTKGGWKATLADLMTACVAEAAKRRLAFQKFSLQDCRPKGVTDKTEAGHTDVQDATLHSNKRMIDQVYDRRVRRVARPVK
jgi:integrase